MEMVNQPIMQPDSINGLQRGKRRNSGFRTLSMEYLDLATGSMSILTRWPRWWTRPLLSMVGSALSHWALEMMINVLKMTSLHGENWCGLNWIICFLMERMQQLFLHLILQLCWNIVLFFMILQMHQ
uniref:NADPHcytochrome P450 reductase CPR P450R n=1 Tax=Rhizophora mucronata TaxID=61149 RepID=A0A2P2MAK8_RHIMU